MHAGAGFLRFISASSFSRTFLMAPLLGVFSLISLPSPAIAQLWISSGFQAGPGAGQETAYCSTSAVNPKTGAATPTAGDYEDFIAACTVTSSTGATFSSSYCPINVLAEIISPSYPYIGNPTGVCTFTFP